MPRLPARPCDARQIDLIPNLPPGVSFVLAPAPRVLATVSPEHPVWSGETPTFPRGAIVRIRPPADASDADVARAKEMLERAGAARVRVEPRAAAAEVLPRKAEQAPAERRTIREVVTATADEARAHDPAALAVFLDEVMSAEGL